MDQSNHEEPEDSAVEEAGGRGAACRGSTEKQPEADAEEEREQLMNLLSMKNCSQK